MNLDNTLIALADSTRRAILARLSQGPAKVTEVAAPFPISLNSVSKHIRILERAGLVRRTVSGREHRLELDAAPLHEITDWMEHHRSFWTQRLGELDALLRAEDALEQAKGKTA